MLWQNALNIGAVKLLPMASGMRRVGRMRFGISLSSFLDLANYLEQFIQGHPQNTLPLVELTKTNVPFKFGASAKKAFENLTNALSHALVLAIADDSKPYVLICDPSGFGCGAVLMQDNRPVAFWSYKMSPAETRHHTGDQELLAVI